MDEDLDRVQSAWTSVRPDTPFNPPLVNAKLARLYDEEQRIGQMGMGLTGIALVLAALDLIGLSAYVVQRQTKEIGRAECTSNRLLRNGSALSNPNRGFDALTRPSHPATPSSLPLSFFLRSSPYVAPWG